MRAWLAVCFLALIGAIGAFYAGYLLRYLAD
jgi:hypothetical protein